MVELIILSRFHPHTELMKWLLDLQIWYLYMR